MPLSILLLDLSNLYYSLKMQYGAKLDFAKLLRFLSEKGFLVERKIAYGSDSSSDPQFLKVLEALGFEIRIKPKRFNKADWDVGIAIDAVRFYQDFDCVIFATGDGDMTPCLELIREEGKKVVVIGSRVSKDLKFVADEVHEITPNLFI